MMVMETFAFFWKNVVCLCGVVDQGSLLWWLPFVVTMRACACFLCGQIGQIHLREVGDIEAAKAALEANFDKLTDLAHGIQPRLLARGLLPPPLHCCLGRARGCRRSPNHC